MSSNIPEYSAFRLFLRSLVEKGGTGLITLMQDDLENAWDAIKVVQQRNAVRGQLESLEEQVADLLKTFDPAPSGPPVVVRKPKAVEPSVEVVKEEAEEDWRWVVLPNGTTTRRYQISDLGRVRSYAMPDNPRILMGSIHKGRRRYSLTITMGGAHGWFYASDLVLNTFRRTAEPGEVSDYLDGDGDNNKLSNLYWRTLAAA